MKKVILLFLLIFLLTGCASQDIDISPDVILGGTSTWGYTEQGDHGQWITADDLYCSVKYTSPADIEGATIDKISMYAREDRSGDLYAKMIIVKASDKTIVANGVSNAVLIPASYGLVEATFPSQPAFSNSTDYYFCAMPDSGSMNLAVAYRDADGYNEWRDTSNSYATPADPTDGSLSGNKEEYSIYITYTTGGEPPPASTYCGHTGGDWYISSDCWISNSTTTQGIIYITETGSLNCTDNAVISAHGIQGKAGTKINGKNGCKIELDNHL